MLHDIYESSYTKNTEWYNINYDNIVNNYYLVGYWIV